MILIDSPSDLASRLATMGQNLAFDFETEGEKPLNYYHMQPFLLSIANGDPNKTLVVQLYKNPDGFRKLLMDELTTNTDRMWIAHNAAFDAKCFRKFCGVIPKRLFCTHIASYLLDENRPSHSLEYLTTGTFGVEKKYKKASKFGTRNQQFFEYSGRDADWCYRLFEEYEQSLKIEHLDHLFYNCEMKFIPPKVNMESVGVLVSQERLKALSEMLDTDIRTLMDRMYEVSGKKKIREELLFGSELRDPDINFNSGPDLLALITELGISLDGIKKTPTGKLSFDKVFLEVARSRHPLIPMLMEFRKLTKLRSTYIRPIQNLTDPDGRVRTNFKTVRTGRTSSSKPNLQNQPHVDPKYNIRNIFVAPEGKMFVAGDFSAQELRWLAIVAGDRAFLYDFAENIDPHLSTANTIFNFGLSDQQMKETDPGYKELKKKYADARQKGKNGLNFPAVFGATAKKIAETLSVDDDTAKGWLRAFLWKHPQIAQYEAKIKKLVEDQGYVETVFGRMRRFPNYADLPKKGKNSKGHAIRAAKNFTIQGPSADQAKIASGRAYAEGLNVVLLVHDEIVAEENIDDTESSKEKLRQAMEGAIATQIPFTVELKSGQSYASMK
jgi:DNA polymerase-1